MDRFSFKEKILNPLEKWSALGETVNEAGSRLIGHVPHIAPKAYMHVVYAPLDQEGFLEFEVFLKREVPTQYREFLALSNGLGLYSGALDVNGFYPTKPKFKRHPHNYAKSFRHSHTGYSWRSRNDLIIGFYKYDSSFSLLHPNGSVSRYLPTNDTVLSEWPDFDEWLFSEINYFSKFFTKEGRMIADSKEIFAPH